jgi:hypothetical protein
MELKSLTQRIKCVGAKSGCLSVLRECLVFSFMRLGVPFYSPKAARSRWRSIWKVILAFCRVVHRTVRCSSLVRDLLPYLAHPTVGPRDRLAHQTLSGAHRTVRCAQPTVRARHASPADCAADRWSRAPLAHRTVR